MPVSQLRVSAIAGFLAAAGFAIAFTLFPFMSDVFNPDAFDHGLAELSSRLTLAMVCQHVFAVTDIAMIVFLFGLARLAPPSHRALASLGAFLFSIAFAIDVLVAGSVIAVAQFIAPHTADPLTHAAGIGILSVVSTLDFREGFFWMAGFAILGTTALLGRYWPRWLAVMALLNAVLSWPYLPTIVFTIIAPAVLVLWLFGMSVLLWQRGQTIEAS